MTTGGAATPHVLIPKNGVIPRLKYEHLVPEDRQGEKPLFEFTLTDPQDADFNDSAILKAEWIRWVKPAEWKKKAARADIWDSSSD